MDNKKIIKKLIKTFAVYGVQIWIFLFVANIGLITFIRFKAGAQTCMTQSQIDADSRCLYVLAGQIYNKGSRNSPHQGHPCGMDVTSIVPSFHTMSANVYLLPNFVAPLCTGPVATDTPVPTAIPTNPPTTAPTQAPTNAPTTAPTNGPTAVTTNTPSKTKTPTPTAKPTTKPTSTSAPLTQGQATQRPTIPPQNDLGNFSKKANNTNDNLDKGLLPTQAPLQTNVASLKTYNLIYWTTIFSYISFLMLLAVGGVWSVQRIKSRRKAIEASNNNTLPH